MTDRKIKRFEEILSQKQVDMDKLRKLAWNGIPSGNFFIKNLTVNPQLRAECWKLLLDYLPIDQEIRQETIRRKREEYADMVNHYFGKVNFLPVSEMATKTDLS